MKIKEMISNATSEKFSNQFDIVNIYRKAELASIKSVINHKAIAVSAGIAPKEALSNAAIILRNDMETDVITHSVPLPKKKRLYVMEIDTSDKTDTQQILLKLTDMLGNNTVNTATTGENK
jgi:hypothetical protein